ncbi:MAG: hypothetical protein R2856_21865 [Caldilineaceae bacterium]
MRLKRRRRRPHPGNFAPNSLDISSMLAQEGGIDAPVMDAVHSRGQHERPPAQTRIVCASRVVDVVKQIGDRRRQRRGEWVDFEVDQPLLQGCLADRTTDLRCHCPNRIGAGALSRVEDVVSLIPEQVDRLRASVSAPASAARRTAARSCSAAMDVVTIVNCAPGNSVASGWIGRDFFDHWDFLYRSWALLDHRNSSRNQFRHSLQPFLHGRLGHLRS